MVPTVNTLLTQYTAQAVIIALLLEKIQVNIQTTCTYRILSIVPFIPVVVTVFR